MIIAVDFLTFPTKATGKKKPEKKSGIRTRDLRDTSIAEVTGSNPEALILFSSFFFPIIIIAQVGEFTAMIILHFHSIVKRG